MIQVTQVVYIMVITPIQITIILKRIMNMIEHGLRRNKEEETYKLSMIEIFGKRDKTKIFVTKEKYEISGKENKDK